VLKKLADALLVTAFLAVLCLPLADSLFSLDPAPPTTERRQLAQWPAFSLSVDYMRELWNSLADYGDFFGFRNTLIRWHNRLELSLWKKQILTGGDVLLGREGWLFLGWPESVDDWRNAFPLSEAELEAMRRTIEARRDRLEEQGCQYLLVIVPNKATVYPEYYPSGFQKLRSDSRLDQIVRFMLANSDVSLLDLRPALIEAKEIGELYYHTDTHWNSLGALVGFREMMDLLEEKVPDLPVPDLDNYVREEIQRAGDLARMLSLSDVLEESTSVLLSRGKAPVRTVRDGLGINPDGGYLYAVERDVASKLPHAVVLGDSFAQTLARFTPACFTRTVFVHGLRVEDFAFELIAQEQPDVVIQEAVERYAERALTERRQ